MKTELNYKMMYEDALAQIDLANEKFQAMVDTNNKLLDHQRKAADQMSQDAKTIAALKEQLCKMAKVSGWSLLLDQ